LSGRALSDIGLGVSGGKLIVDGDFGLCNMVVSTDPLLGNTGFLEGNGRLGMTFAYGTLSPGHDGPGRLTCKSCDMSINSALMVELGGTNAGIDCDQLVVEDNFGFETSDPVLDMRMLAGFVGSVGNQYTIVRNDGTNQIAGHFNGLPEGASCRLAGGAVFRISYRGGDGNEVVLTQLVAVPILGTPRFTVDGQVQLSGTGSPGVSYAIEANTNLADAAGWLPIGSVQAGLDGMFSFTDAQPTTNHSQYYQLRAP
jgi:trimeric autotransporter adhesin